MVMSLQGVLKRKLRKQSYNNCLKQVLNQSRRGQRHQLLAINHSVGVFQGKATEEELQQPLLVVSELVQGSPVTSIAGDEALTELEAKYTELQEQLHYTKEGNSLLNLEEKEQKTKCPEGHYGPR